VLLPVTGVVAAAIAFGVYQMGKRPIAADMPQKPLTPQIAPVVAPKAAAQANQVVMATPTPDLPGTFTISTPAPVVSPVVSPRQRRPVSRPVVNNSPVAPPTGNSTTSQPQVATKTVPYITAAEVSYNMKFQTWVENLSKAVPKGAQQGDRQISTRENFMPFFAEVDGVWQQSMGVYAPSAFAASDSLFRDGLMQLRQAKLQLQLNASFEEFESSTKSGARTIDQAVTRYAEIKEGLRNDPTRMRTVPADYKHEFLILDE